MVLRQKKRGGIWNEWRGRAEIASIKMEKMERTKRERSDKKEVECWGWYIELCCQSDPKDEQSFYKK
jgi:hypothetical protein